jgi:translation initiation factor IF-3
MAEEAGLDLVEISPNAVPPVTKILDLGKLKYANQKKAAEARKNQKRRRDQGDQDAPQHRQSRLRGEDEAPMRRFFEEGDKVKLTLKFPWPRNGAPWNSACSSSCKVREEDTVPSPRSRPSRSSKAAR